ncbi:TRAP transporter small permease [Celeribacter neptunius]|uniref:TRAP transporter small permease protein n=1 Tax=Celeribacter neptunius TaxID=588602 RepID=A0A1I3XWD2_9RHOB|nr:TRAP transporter small permease [Celeribacter neptunius]SFK23803.1 TRAP-type C4-dicarboxylate transport system, small permease component [Celeribacter neptunius]
MSYFSKLSRAMSIGAAFFIAIIILATLYDVLTGLITGRPVSGVYEIVETCLAFTIFLAVPEIFRIEGNIRIDLIDYVVPRPVLRLIRAIARVLTFGFALLISVAVLSPFRDAIMFGDTKYETGIPVWFIWLPIVIGSAFATLATVFVIIWPDYEAKTYSGKE